MAITKIGSTSKAYKRTFTKSRVIKHDPDEQVVDGTYREGVDELLKKLIDKVNELTDKVNELDS